MRKKKLVLFLLIMVIMSTLFYAFKVKEIVVFNPSYPALEEVEGKPTKISVSSKQDIDTIMDIINSAAMTDYLPYQVSVLLRLNVNRTFFSKGYEIVYDDDLGQYFISIDLDKQKSFTISEHQFLTLKEIFER